jgi:hypothetical protein
MKIVLFTNHLTIIPAINYFYSYGWLSAMISTGKLHAESSIEDVCHQNAIGSVRLHGRIKDARFKPASSYSTRFSFYVRLYLPDTQTLQPQQEPR